LGPLLGGPLGRRPGPNTKSGPSAHRAGLIGKRGGHGAGGTKTPKREKNGAFRYGGQKKGCPPMGDPMPRAIGGPGFGRRKTATRGGHFQPPRKSYLGFYRVGSWGTGGAPNLTPTRQESAGRRAGGGKRSEGLTCKGGGGPASASRLADGT